MRKLAAHSSLSLVVLIAGIAAADDKKGGGGGGGNGKVKVYDFSGDTIEGDLVKPEGSTVDARDFAKHSSPDHASARTSSPRSSSRPRTCSQERRSRARLTSSAIVRAVAPNWRTLMAGAKVPLTFRIFKGDQLVREERLSLSRHQARQGALGAPEARRRDGEPHARDHRGQRPR